jgi:hypothetical protein
MAIHCRAAKNSLRGTVIYHSSLVKGAMNAARLCKLRNGVKKTPHFLLFSIEKGGPSAQ